jgi:hypothetical protein
MVTARTTLLLIAASLLLGAMLGYGVATTRERAPLEPPWGTAFGPGGGSGSGAFSGLPGLPRGLTVDANGIVRAAGMEAEPGTVLLDWDTLLAFQYQPKVGLTALPEDITALEGKRVTMVGFMMPLYEFTDIRQFAFVGSHWSCCFGRPAGLNGTLNVTIQKDHASMEHTLEPLRVVGTFRAKEVKESGFLLSIFSLDDASVRPIQ